MEKLETLNRWLLNYRITELPNFSIPSILS